MVAAGEHAPGGVPAGLGVSPHHRCFSVGGDQEAAEQLVREFSASTRY